MASIHNLSSNEEKLHRAVTNRNIVNILEVLKEDVDLKGIDPYGNTVIHLAFRNCDSDDNTEQQIIDILKIFLDRGVNINVANIGGFTALHLAMVHGMRRVIKFLLERKANVHVTDEYGNTLIHYFVKGEFEKFEKFDVETNDSDIIKLESAHFLNWLAAIGFKLDCTNNYGLCPVHLAIQYNLQHLILILLKHTRHMNLNANVNKLLLHRFFEAYAKLKKPCIKFGDFSLFLCNSQFLIEIVKRLLDIGISVDTVNGDKETVLHVAIKYKLATDILELLANHFTAVRATDNHGKTALDLVIEEWWRDCKIDGHLRVVRILVSKGADISQRNSSGLTPVQQAVVRNNFDLLRLLKEKGADFKVLTLKGENLLHLVHADNKMIEFLVDQGVDINGCDNEGISPLHAEVWQRCSPKVKLLLKFGANVDILDNNGFSILRKAICQRNLYMVKELLNYGVDIDDYEILSHFRMIDNDVKGYLLRHIIKMSTARLPGIDDCERAVGRKLILGPFREECQREIIQLKEIFINDHMSLLDFLQLDPNRKCAFVKNKKLRNLLNDPTLRKRFPNYSILLLGCYLQTVRRKFLLKPAECAWYKLTGILLPHVCVDRILAHLSNVNLMRMVRRCKQLNKRPAVSTRLTDQPIKRPKIVYVF